MAKRPAWPFSKRRKKGALTEQSVLLLFLTVVAAGLVVSVLAQQSGQTKKAVGEAPAAAPDYSALLPGGVKSDGSAELVDSTTPTYVVAYKDEGTAYLALAVWSKEEGRYALVSPLPLSAGERHLAGVTSLSVERLGPGVPTLILAKGPEAAATAEGVMIVGREGDALDIVKKLEKDGLSGAALFPVGATAEGERSLEVADVNDDGVFEVVATLSGRGAADVTVYVWAHDRLEYDEKLSWAMTMDRQLFPEPVSAPSSDSSG